MAEFQHPGRHQFGVGAVVADTDDLLVDGHPVLQQRILVAVETVLRDLQLHRCPKEGDALTARLYQMAHGVIGPHIVVDYHTAGIHARTYSIVEDERDARID